MLKHYNIAVYGRVQGVDFRTTAKREAQKLGVTGFAHNEPQGSVYMEAEGEEGALQKFIEWCKTGTPRSRVERVEISEDPVQNFKGFKIVRPFYGDDF